MKKLTALLMAALLALQTGCGGIYSNFREISELQLIETMGFDLERGQVRLSVSTGKTPGNGEPVVMSAAGDSIHQAAETLQDYSVSEDIFYSHCRYILLGESAAADAARYMDYIERSVQTRMDVPLLVLRDVTARELVTETGDDKSTVTQALASLERDAKRRGETRFFTVGEVATALASNGAALCVCLRAEESGPVSGKKGLSPLPDGFAVLKDGALAGFIRPSVSRGVTLLLGELDAGSVDLPGGVTVELAGGEAEFIPRWEGDALAGLTVELALTASVVELRSPLDISDERVLSLLGTLLAREAAGWVEAVLERSASLGADFMGLGHHIALASPFKWDGIKADWAEIFPELPVSVTAQAEILRSYDITDPVSVRGES